MSFKIYQHLKIILFSLLLTVTSVSYSQDVPISRSEELTNTLDSLSKDIPGLNEKVDFSLSNVKVKELFRAVGESAKVNIDVDPKIDFKVVNNFSNVTVKDVLVYLCKQYSLQMEITGNIFYITPYTEKKIAIIKELDVQFKDGLLNLNLKRDTLSAVCKKLTDLTGVNILMGPKIGGNLINLYLKNIALDQALEKLAFTNDLELEHQKDGTYLLRKKEVVKSGKNKGNRNNRNRNKKDNNRLNVTVKDAESHIIDLIAEGAELNTVMETIFQKLELDYFIYSKLEGTINTHVVDQPLIVVLDYLINNTKYICHKRDGIYLIGERQKEGLRESTLIPIRHRNVENITSYIPKNLIKDVDIKEFPDLNSVIVSGSQKNITEIENFLDQIDKPVPVIMIEVMILDYSKNEALETGIEMGIGENPANSGGGLYPNLNYNLNAQSINKLVNSFNGFGALNIGSVTPNFYMSIKALEQNGIINVRSTPQLSALNGQEASLTIGKTEYYLVEQSNTIGSQNPQLQTTQNWQNVEANLTITIKPNVSENGEVTLKIQVDQSDFTGRIAPTAPPGSVTRNFSSLMRIKDGEMILLGGLEEASTNDTGSGVPFLSRIPIIKWFFSKRLKSDSKKKLNIFIKPTVIY